MNWQTAKEIITVVLSIFGGVGLVMTPIVVAIINNRPKTDDKSKVKDEAQASVSTGLAVNLDYQVVQSNTLMKYLEDTLEGKNEAEKEAAEYKFELRALRDKYNELLNKKDQDNS